MTISRRGGVTGKICCQCRAWKRLSDFSVDSDRRKFKGYRQLYCRDCEKLMKNKK